jgi:hypothetical protein
LRQPAFVEFLKYSVQSPKITKIYRKKTQKFIEHEERENRSCLEYKMFVRCWNFVLQAAVKSGFGWVLVRGRNV